MTATEEGGEWSAAWPSRTLPPGKTLYPFYRRLGGPQVPSRRAENFVPTGIRSRIVHSYAAHKTIGCCVEICIACCKFSSCLQQTGEILCRFGHTVAVNSWSAMRGVTQYHVMYCSSWFPPPPFPTRTLPHFVIRSQPITSQSGIFIKYSWINYSGFQITAK